MADVLTLADMPDLSDWRLAPLWTLGLAAPHYRLGSRRRHGRRETML